MNHPAFRWSAAAFLLLTVVMAGWLVMGGATQVALAKFAEPLINAKTAKFKLTSRVDGKVIVVANALVDGSRMRMELNAPDDRKQITVINEQTGVEFIQLPGEKRVEIVRMVNRPENAKTGGFLQEVRQMLLDVEQGDGKTTREPLGERDQDGQRLAGYRIANPAMTLELWGDPATGLPHSLTQTMSAYPSMTTTMSEFEFDMPFDESLLSQEPPEGYAVSERTVDVSPRTEADVVAALRTAAELNDGVFPDALNMEFTHGLVQSYRKRNDAKLSDDELEEVAQELTTTIARGFGFTLQFPADRHRYSGKGVRVGTRDKVIYWYQPEGKESYRVIYADLSVADVKEKPNAE